MTIKTTCVIPPPIIEYFSHALLSMPAKLCDDSESLWRIYTYIKIKLMHKANYRPEWKAKCERLEQEFLKLYERAKTKEKNIKAETGYKTKEPFYRIDVSNRSNQNVFEGLRYKSYSTAHESRKTYAVQET
jgi:hypothetical protein